MENTTVTSAGAPRIETSEFDKLTGTIVAQHEEHYGKVSASTGWRSVVKSKFYGGKTGITGGLLVNSIERSYGKDVAAIVEKQLSLTSKKSINSYQVAKAVAMVKELRLLRDIKMTVKGTDGETVERSLNPNDEFYLKQKAIVELSAFTAIIAGFGQMVLHENVDTNDLSSLQAAGKTAKKAAKTLCAANQKDFKTEYKEALNKQLRKQEWPVITTEMTLDPQKPTEKVTTTITPAGQIPEFKEIYEAGVNGIPSGDTSSSHAVGLRINDCNGFEIVSSGLDVPLDAKKSTDSKIGKRFKERLILNLKTQNKLPSGITQSPTEDQLGSKDKPITISMADFGEVTADVSKEGKAQDLQFAFLKQYDGSKSIEVTYTNAEGNDVTIHVKPTVRAFNFGVQWIDRSIIGRTWTLLKGITFLKGFFGFGFETGLSRALKYWGWNNAKAFDQLVGPSTSIFRSAAEQKRLSEASDTGKALSVIEVVCNTPSEKLLLEQRTLLEIIYKNNTGKELPSDITEAEQTELKQIKKNIEQLQNQIQSSRSIFHSSTLYHEESLVVVLSSMIGVAPNIHCKSGKDRTSLLLSYSQWLMHEIKTYDTIPQPPYTAEQNARLDKFFVGTGNGHWQFLNTLNVGNKQAAGWFSFRSNFYKTLSPSLQTTLAGNEAESSV